MWVSFSEKNVFTIMFQVLQLGGDNHGVDVAVGRVDGGKIRQVPRYETRHMGNRDMTFLDQKRSDRSPHQTSIGITIVLGLAFPKCHT